MSIEQMRAVLRKCYNGSPYWANTVDGMSHQQVLAIYNRKLAAGELKGL